MCKVICFNSKLVFSRKGGGGGKHLDKEHKDPALTIFVPGGKIIHHLLFIKTAYGVRQYEL